MKNVRCWLALILVTSLVVSLLMLQIYSGAYIRSTPPRDYTYFIGVVSTTIPFVFWALVIFAVSLIKRGWANHSAAMIGGYWLAGLVWWRSASRSQWETADRRLLGRSQRLLQRTLFAAHLAPTIPLQQFLRPLGQHPANFPPLALSRGIFIES
jgi:hypothetical protein